MIASDNERAVVARRLPLTRLCCRVRSETEGASGTLEDPDAR